MAAYSQVSVRSELQIPPIFFEAYTHHILYNHWPDSEPGRDRNLGRSAGDLEWWLAKGSFGSN